MNSWSSVIQGMDQLNPKTHPDLGPSLGFDVEDCFVISRYSSGEVLSRYGDKIWDLSPYSSISSTTKPQIRFGSCSATQLSEVKKIGFALMYHAQGGRKSVLSANYICSMMQALKVVAKYADENELKTTDVLCDISAFKKFLRQKLTRSTVEKINGIITNLVGNNQSNHFLKGLSFRHLELTKKRIMEFPDTEQTPVIPQSILSKLMYRLNRLFDEIENDFPRLIDLLTMMANDILYGRGKSTQILKGCSTENLRPTFKEAVREHKLSPLFNKYNLNNIKDLTKFLSRIMHATQVQIAIFSGMRIGEIIALNVGCLKIKEIKNQKIYILHGKTSKYSGGNVKAEWVTDVKVMFPIKMCEQFALLGHGVLGLKLDQIPLFLSPSYTITTIKRPRHQEKVTRVQIRKRELGVYGLLGLTNFEITQSDFKELKSTEPFRDWGADQSYQVGSDWPFSFHQFRRSLAFYAVQKGLLTLPSLQMQYKHLTRSITVFYGQSRGVALVSTRTRHFKEFMNLIKPEADLICYVNDLLNSSEPLQGVAGRSIEKTRIKKVHNNEKGRLKILNDFKKGNIAYSVTPLGGCLSLYKCTSKSVGNLSACVSCRDAVVKPSKLEKVISRQETLLGRCKENNLDNFEFRYEERELEILKGFRSKILRKGNLS